MGRTGVHSIGWHWKASCVCSSDWMAVLHFLCVLAFALACANMKPQRTQPLTASVSNTWAACEEVPRVKRCMLLLL